MWWREVAGLASLAPKPMSAAQWLAVDRHPTAIIDETNGRVEIGAGTKICPAAYIAGPAVIGRDCLIGNNAMIRGPLKIGDRVRVGFAAELKQALIGDDVSIGPQCFVADSKLDSSAYLGAQVRTSNQRLDRRPVSVLANGEHIHTGLEKLGCWIGVEAALGIQCIILPGREIAAGSLFEPRITIARNHPTGHYRAATEVVRVAHAEGA